MSPGHRRVFCDRAPSDPDWHVRLPRASRLALRVRAAAEPSRGTRRADPATRSMTAGRRRTHGIGRRPAALGADRRGSGTPASIWRQPGSPFALTQPWLRTLLLLDLWLRFGVLVVLLWSYGRSRARPGRPAPGSVDRFVTSTDRRWPRPESAAGAMSRDIRSSCPAGAVDPDSDDGADRA